MKAIMRMNFNNTTRTSGSIGIGSEIEENMYRDLRLLAAALLMLLSCGFLAFAVMTALSGNPLASIQAEELPWHRGVGAVLYTILAIAIGASAVVIGRGNR
jgi:hypothetical protein